VDYLLEIYDSQRFEERKSIVGPGYPGIVGPDYYFCPQITPRRARKETREGNTSHPQPYDIRFAQMRCSTCAEPDLRLVWQGSRRGEIGADAWCDVDPPFAYANGVSGPVLECAPMFRYHAARPVSRVTDCQKVIYQIAE